MSFYLKQVEVGLMQNFNYLIGDPQTKECAYIDPAWEVDRMLRIAEEDGYRITQIWLTHKHFDHTEGVREAVEKTGATVFIHPLDADEVDLSGLKTHSLKANEEIKVGALTVSILHTPGHTPGSVSYLVQDPDDGRMHLFTGDTLFQGNCGRTDLPGGNSETLFKSLQIIKTLDPTTKIYPGHDYGTKQVSTIAYEKEHNYTLKPKSFEEFDRLS